MTQRVLEQKMEAGTLHLPKPAKESCTNTASRKCYYICRK